MRLGISTYACTWAIGVQSNMPVNPMNAIDFLRFAKNHGFSLVQIADNLPLATLDAGQLEELHRTAHHLGITVEVGIRGLTDDNMTTYFPIAKLLGSTLLRVVADSANYHPSKEQIVESLRKWEQIGRINGITIGLENHDRFSCRDLRYIMESVSSPFVGICLDTVNSFGAMEGPEHVIGMLAPFVVNVHLKDFTIYRPYHNMGFVLDGTPAGEGKLDIAGIVANPVINKRPETTAVLELWVPPQATLEQTIALEEQWVIRSYTNIQVMFER